MRSICDVSNCTLHMFYDSFGDENEGLPFSVPVNMMSPGAWDPVFPFLLTQPSQSPEHDSKDVAFASKVRTNGDFFMVANKRVAALHAGSGDVRQTILNALRTCVPALGALVVADVVFDLIIYDFYFEGSTLRMAVLNMHTLEPYDSFAFETDVMHMLSSGRTFLDIPDKENINWSHWSSTKPSLRNFWIKCGALNTFQNLDTGICIAAKRAILNSSLQNWLSGETRSFLAMANVGVPPRSYSPITDKVAANLNAAVSKLTPMSDDGKCHEVGCVCAEMKQRFNREHELGIVETWSPMKMFEFVRSSVTHTATFLSSIHDLYIIKADKDKHKQKQPKVKVVKKKEYRITRDVNGKQTACMFNYECKGVLVGFFVACCSANNPILCEAHTPGGVSRCPKHQVLSSAAILKM
jgi:hypothetical protein